ncbi:hypothetical protein CDD83_7223 [Cordyceps sp. RAO-2017]|nr:hypothetical protein CDD83_7223 [Cordyceps sp. RAO-2017]
MQDPAVAPQPSSRRGVECECGPRHIDTLLGRPRIAVLQLEQVNGEGWQMGFMPPLTGPDVAFAICLPRGAATSDAFLGKGSKSYTPRTTYGGSVKSARSYPSSVSVTSEPLNPQTNSETSNSTSQQAGSPSWSLSLIERTRVIEGTGATHKRHRG